MTPCKTCKGKGRWQMIDRTADGGMELTWYECGDCKGSGVSQAADDNGDFSVAGDEDDD